MNHLQNVKKKEENRKCTTCDKMFTDRRNLNKHIKSVHEGNMFSCDQCSKTYTRKASLIDHVSRHHDKTKCKICNINFSNSITLKKHMQTKHESEQRLNFLQKSRKPISECTNKYKLDRKAI